ncbi:MAG: hypothetical protein DMG76_02180 [Acidobacteria bacterium]|nr:MAG: hypothetical protein DMG76_02180 [Acidobacteriota bacterium]
MTEKYYRTDEKENAVDFLEVAATFYAGNHPHKWKWLTISLHGALYGFAVLAIRGTDPDRVSKGKNKKLIGLWEVLKRCQDDAYMLQYSGSRRVDVSHDENLAIKKLSAEFRNNFEHFMPKLWSIEVSGFPAIVGHVCRVISFLAFESGNVGLTPGQRRKVVHALDILLASPRPHSR